VPGAGAAIAAFVAYQQSKTFSKTPELYGTGHVEGLIAPESANNGVTSGTLIPLLVIGIPGGATAAIVPPPPAQAPRPVAILSVESFGEIRFELIPEIAPATVENFIKLASEKFYDGTTFHRVIPGFMIQGGSPSTRKSDARKHGRGGLAEFPDEFSEVTHTRGAVSLANKGRKNTAAGQFFIVHEDSPRLDGSYTIFGRVSDGMEVVDAITEMEIDEFGRYGPENRPHPRDARILTIRMEPAGKRPVAAPGPTG
jgi:peptidyl-prolyl cis-trans isomerase B (cyclophilin B)